MRACDDPNGQAVMTEQSIDAHLQDAVAALPASSRAGVEQLLAAIPAEDRAEREPRDLVGAAASMSALASHRSPGETLVHVFTPTVREHGWASRRTVIGICTDDAPFLVDSVAAALAHRELTVHLLLHPLVSVRRDELGELLEVGVIGGEVESWMHIEVDRIAGEEERAALEERLRKVLADVHHAVNDWRSMRRACLDVATLLRTDPPATADPATVKPTVEFLDWLADDHFTFLGYREYALEQTADGEEALRALPHTGLGVLRDAEAASVVLRPEAQRSAHDPRLLTITKANTRATVHRDAYLDYIGIRTFDGEGRVIGERRFIGLFTSVAYASSVLALPIVGAKVRAVLAASGFSPSSHSGKDLQQILEQYPRDELFQDTPEHLHEVASEVSRLNERRRARIFLRHDEFGRYVSALVFLPRDRYNTTVRLRIDALLRRVFDAERVDHTTKVGDSPLAQLHFVVRVPRGGSIPEVDEAELQREVDAAVRTWETALVDAVHAAHDEESAAALLSRYGAAFPEAYRVTTSPEAAVRDIARLEGLADENDVAAYLYVGDGETDPAARRLTVVSTGAYPLTQVLPMLTALGVDVLDELPFTISPAGGEPHRISDFGLTVPDAALWGDADRKRAFEEAFRAVWSGQAESDGLNALVLRGGLGWRDIVILRAVGRYLRQIGSAFSSDYIDQALVANPGIAARLVHLFEASFDPDAEADRAARVEAATADVLADLDRVASLDHDRILRSFLGVIRATLRTNFYTRDAAGAPKPWVSLKIECAEVPGLPKPHPMVEIWVYSPQVEGVHLRFGRVARGGLRWSDRREDFRTEVLGLVKAQMVKNAVIVPTGSKGGFVAKQLPDPAVDRGAWFAEGKSAYRTFIRGLLDVTDNRVGGDIVPPERVVRRDGDDPYLVVAADKGTATFSDIANGIAQEYGFWLDDAFASGGSAGYDHKGMGITARGAWESVKRHFRELGHDVQTEDFTVVGVGDMSGDVFGNGMLLSPRIRLVAAFDHRHVFVDPDPDADVSFAERLRLFQLPGSSWADYDPALISAGGGVFPLSAKSIAVSPEMRRALGLDAEVAKLTPAELKRAVLLAPVDLLWNGGIGTYVKASTETNAEIGDRANDAIRIDGNALRVRVVGEGGNLGVSQRGRIEASLNGIHINTDAIDNSAGVGTSDREVNIKILLNALVREGRISLPERDELLRSMTDEVAVQVLRDNYEQNVLLGNSRANAAVMLPLHERLIEWLEGRDELDRELEFLPDLAEIGSRIANGAGLTRPEFSVLVAYTKLALKTDLAATDLADDPWFAGTLAEYFPAPIRASYAADLAGHPLRREIVVNSVVNSMVNRGGITFAYRATEESGADAGQIARAFVAAREIFDLRGFVVAVEATDNLVAADVQTDLYLEFRRLLDRAARWFAQHRSDGVDIGGEIATFSAPVAAYANRMDALLHGSDLERFTARVAELEAAGVPSDLARRGAGLLWSLPLLDIVEAARTRGEGVEEVAGAYFAVSAAIRFQELHLRISALPQEDLWESMARAALRDDLYSATVLLTASVLDRTAPGEPEERVAAWIAGGGSVAERALAALAAAHAVPVPGIATLSVALRQLRSLVR